MIILLAALTGAACERGGEWFHVEGHITEAKDTMLYLEHLSMGEGAVRIDSVRLGADGAFSLKGRRPGNPEFYRLRIGAQVVNLSIDSTETIGVEASLPKMTLGYSVTGSGNCDTIRMLNLKLDTLNRRIRSVAEDRSLTIAERETRIENLISEYKREVKLRYIQNRYDRASSYYAMFQMTEGGMVFNPVSDASDVTWFAALANSWDMLYPGAVRTENLKNIALQGHRNTRRKTIEIDMDNEKVSETGIIDMGFPDGRGQERRLSDLRGKVVLLDFTAYGLQGTQERTLALRQLYDNYHSRGLEIYQVGLDGNEHFWKTMSEQLPWICVHCKEGTESDMLNIYNVQVLPTWFLIDRDLNLIGRMEMMGDLDEEIRKLL